MTEHKAVENTPMPNTRVSLAEDLRKIGLEAEDVVIVHSSLSKLGWTAGGAVAVVEALMDVLTSEGTLVMPTHSASNTDPAHWQNPPVPETWWPIIYEHMPAYDPRTTPTRQMGAIVECFRTYPHVLRSAHPSSSFAAWGKYAEFVTSNHDLSEDFGDRSPLGRIYELNSKVLLLGVLHSNNTSLHLAEFRSDYTGKKWEIQGAAMLVNGQRQWVKFEVLEADADNFVEVGTAYETSIGYKPVKIGQAETRLLSQCAIVDFAVQWFQENRKEKQE